MCDLWHKICAAMEREGFSPPTKNILGQMSFPVKNEFWSLFHVSCPRRAHLLDMKNKILNSLENKAISVAFKWEKWACYKEPDCLKRKVTYMVENIYNLLISQRYITPKIDFINILWLFHIYIHYLNHIQQPPSGSRHPKSHSHQPSRLTLIFM